MPTDIDIRLKWKAHKHTDALSGLPADRELLLLERVMSPNKMATYLLVFTLCKTPQLVSEVILNVDTPFLYTIVGEVSKLKLIDH